MKFSFSRFLILSVAVALLVTQPVSAQVVNIPDPNLREAIREALELPPDAPITQQETANLTRFAAWNKDIKDLTGLEHAIHLNHLSLRFNQITDLSPIANLIHLEGLMLDDNPISDISPLAGLINLKILRIPQTLVTDFTPLQGLNLTEFHYDQICNMPPVHPPVTERIKNRSFPSVFQAWGGIGWSPVENRPDLSDEEHITLHDLLGVTQLNSR